MTSLPVLMDVDAHKVATLTLNRPDKANACNQPMLDRLAELIARVGADPAIRVVVLRGSGKYFCSGRDISDATQPDSRNLEQTSFLDVCRALDAVPKPTIAVIRGGCIGGGASLVACCDFAIASSDSFFALPEARVGLAPGPLALICIRAMQHRGLRRYLLSGERFTAERARELQLIHEVQPPSNIEKLLSEAIDSFLLGAPGALSAAKTVLAKSATALNGHLFDEVSAIFEWQARSDEAAEGKASFRAKRRPSWYPAPAR